MASENKISQFNDFEDAIQYFAAKAEGGVAAIITRNKTDFATSEFPVWSPEDFLARRETKPQ